jgi:transmembrane sensor
MRNSTIKPSREMISEASKWLIEFRTSDPSQAERDRFKAWLCTSPQHIQAYFEVAAAWSELPDADPEGRIDIQQMIRAARESGDANVVELGARFKSRDTRVRSHSMKFVAIAASVLVLLFVATTYSYFQRGVYQTQTGEQRSLTLADGSTVDLNVRSKIRVRYSDHERRVELVKGQALFRVARNPARPFIVETDGTEVRAVGTQFDVYRKASGTVVTVLEGKVAVGRVSADDGERMQATASAPPEERGTHEILLAAGEQLTVQAAIADKGVIAAPRPADIEAATAWTQKRLVFEDTPLIDVAEEFNRYNVRRLVIADESLGKIGVSGLYSSTDPSALIAFLSTQPSILLTESDTEIRITRR